VGYARVSTDDQTNALQADAMVQANVDVVFHEEASGGRTEASVVTAGKSLSEFTVPLIPKPRYLFAALPKRLGIFRTRSSPAIGVAGSVLVELAPGSGRGEMCAIVARRIGAPGSGYGELCAIVADDRRAVPGFRASGCAGAVYRICACSREPRSGVSLDSSPARCRFLIA
jgi:hypothetical protein